MNLLGFALVVGLVLVIGIGLGMLVAPRLDRWTERHEREDDEEPRDDGPG